jgi:hypothetical protein
MIIDWPVMNKEVLKNPAALLRGFLAITLQP